LEDEVDGVLAAFGGALVAVERWRRRGRPSLAARAWRSFDIFMAAEGADVIVQRPDGHLEVAEIL